jgi:hypothetical protein
MNARHENAGSTEPTLQCVVTAESLLEIVQYIVFSERLDRIDSVSMALHGEHQTGSGCHAVYQYGAGATHAVFAAHMNSSCPKIMAQEVAPLRLIETIKRWSALARISGSFYKALAQFAHELATIGSAGMSVILGVQRPSHGVQLFLQRITEFQPVPSWTVADSSDSEFSMLAANRYG